MPKASKKKAKTKKVNAAASSYGDPTKDYRPSVSAADDGDDDDSGIPPLESAPSPSPTNQALPKLSTRTGLTPELESVHLTASANLQAHAVAGSPELGKTVQDLYRSLGDPMQVPEDSDYWLSLPPTIKSFVQSAYAHGVFPNSDGPDKDRMYATAQQMKANGVQPGSKRTANGAIATPPHPPGAYPSFPAFDPAMFGDPAFAQALEQLVPRPVAQASMQQANYANARGRTDHPSDDDGEDFEPDGNTGGGRSEGIIPPPPPTSKVPATPSLDPSAKNKQKKVSGKAALSVPPTPSLPPPPNPVPAPPVQKPVTAPVPKTQTVSSPPTLAPPSRPAPNPTPAIPPSTRAAGKQPMPYTPAAPSSNAPPPRSTRHGKQPATAPQAPYHHSATTPVTNSNTAPTKPRPPASAPISNPAAPPGTVTPGQPPGKKKENKIWNSTATEDRERIKEFWLGLSEKERRKLVELEKDAVLKKMKEQQRHSCACNVCGRKRSAIEDELEVLYDAYYDELEMYANQQQQYVNSPSSVLPPPGPGPFPGSVEIDANGAVIPNDLTKHPSPPIMPDEDDYDEEEDYDEEGSEEGSEDDEEEDDQEQMPAAYPKGARRSAPGRGPQKGVINGTGGKKAIESQQDFFTFGPSLTVAGNILTVADELLKNDGTKFLEMMEQLAERRMYREELAASAMMDEDDSEDDEDGSEDEDDNEDEDDEDEEDEELTEEHKMEEGRRMFSIFAARMFEQRVLVAYREKVAQDRQMQLIRELEEEDRAAAERDAKKTRDNQKKKDKRKQQKQAKEEEAARRAREQAEKEAADKARKAQQEEDAKKRREEERVKRELDRKAREEEKMRKDLERRKRQAEEREAQAKLAAERKKEKEEREREAARLKKEKEDRERADREEKRRIDAERAAAEAERLKEEAAKKAKEDKERAEREAEAARKAAEEKAAAAAKAAASMPQPVASSSQSTQGPSQSQQPSRANSRTNGAQQGNKKAPPKLASVPSVPGPSSAAPSIGPPAIPRPSPTPSAIPQQRLAPSPGLPVGPIGRRATAPAMNPSPAGPPPPIQFPLMSATPFGPPSPASMSFSGSGPFNSQNTTPQQRPPPPLQPSPLPQFGADSGFIPAPQTNFGPPAPIGSGARRTANGSPGPNAIGIGVGVMSPPGAIAPPGPIGSAFSPGGHTHSRRSSLDPIGARPGGFGAITRPAPIGSTRPPGTPGGPANAEEKERSESPERLGSSALLDPTDEPLPSSSARRGAPFWPAPTDIGKSPPGFAGAGGAQWGSFPVHPLPPPGTPWGVSPALPSANGTWPPQAPRAPGFSPIAGNTPSFFSGATSFPAPPASAFGAIGAPPPGGGSTNGGSNTQH